MSKVSVSSIATVYFWLTHTIQQKEMSKIHMEQFVFQVQLNDPEFIFRLIGFTNFLETWLVRLVDPKKSHPDPNVKYVYRQGFCRPSAIEQFIHSVPLPKEIPDVFRMLPEYFVEDIVDFLLFVMKYSPTSFELSGREELIIWSLTFLRSTWYIKNPFLKAKINEVSSPFL